jgi:hypothetical protein
MYQLAPAAPPCFPSRLDWIEWLASAAAAQVKGREPGPLLLRQGAAPTAGAFAAFDLTLDFCVDCDPAWRKQARVVERGVCRPDWLRQFAPEPVASEPEPAALAEEELCLSIASPGEMPPSPASSGASPCSSAAEKAPKRPKLWPIVSISATASEMTAAAASSAPASSPRATPDGLTAASRPAAAGSAPASTPDSSRCGACSSAAPASTTSSPDPMNPPLQRHPLSALLPDLTEEETAGLRASIAANGVIDAITLYEGQVLDGWNRYTCATLEQVACPTTALPEGIDPVEFVRSRTRGRNMTKSALALLEVELNSWRSVGRPGKGEAASPFPAATTAEMAARAQTSERTIEQAKAASQATDAVKAAIKGGKISVEKGAKLARLPAEEQAAALTAPKAPPPSLEQVQAEAAAAAGAEDYAPTPTELLEEQEAIIRTLQERLASAEADDAKAELIRLRVALQNAERAQRETMDRAAQHQSEARKSGETIGQLCRLLDLDDTRKLVAAVKALKARADAAA